MTGVMTDDGQVSWQMTVTVMTTKCNFCGILLVRILVLAGKEVMTCRGKASGSETQAFSGTYHGSGGVCLQSHVGGEGESGSSGNDDNKDAGVLRCAAARRRQKRGSQTYPKYTPNRHR
jgi:hypothetical protein